MQRLTTLYKSTSDTGRGRRGLCIRTGLTVTDAGLRKGTRQGIKPPKRN